MPVDAAFSTAANVVLSPTSSRPAVSALTPSRPIASLNALSSVEAPPIMRQSRRHRVTVATSAPRSSCITPKTSSPSASSSASSSPSPHSSSVSSSSTSSLSSSSSSSFSPKSSSTPSPSASTITSPTSSNRMLSPPPSPPPSPTPVTQDSASQKVSEKVRRRASSPSSKSRYISRLRDALHFQCAKSTDAFWSAMQEEARDAAENEPLLASFLFSTVLNHPTLYSALAFHLANKLSSPAMPSTMLMQLFQTIMQDDDAFCGRIRRDLLAYMERDPACTRFIDALLYFKGFHALQAHRIAHALWLQGRTPLAYHLQSQVSQALQVDIHPAACLGEGIFLDHATGIVVGETAVIGDDCSILHHVTLGGSGKKHGERHPKLGNGVLVGAGATLLGNVRVGEGAQIGACSLVLEDIPPHATVVGVPARVINVPGVAVPALEMKHERCLANCTDASHGHPVPSSDVSQD